jgi:hypothetical protein
MTRHRPIRRLTQTGQRPDPNSEQGDLHEAPTITIGCKPPGERHLPSLTRSIHPLIIGDPQ